MGKENFYYAEGSTFVKDIIKNITKEITGKAGTYKWDLVHPSKVDEIKDFSLIKATTSYNKQFYIRLERTAALTPTSDEQKLLDKETYGKPLTDDEIKLLNRYMESLPLTSHEIALIKKDIDSLNESEQMELQEIRERKAINTDRELELLRKYNKGQSLGTDEQNELDTYKKVHVLEANEIKKWTELKQNKKIFSDYIAMILYKQYKGIEISPSEQSSLASYRKSLELTQKEIEKLSLLKGKMDNRNHMYIAIGKEIKKAKRIDHSGKEQKEIDVQDLVEDSCSPNFRLAWYIDLDPEINEYLPVEYFINVTKDAVNLILIGDPSADNYPYGKSLTSYCYIGALKPLEDSAYTDDEYNFGVTTSSDIPPVFSKKFGSRTATGVTDVCMIGNRIGMPMQPHTPAYYTTTTFVDKCNTRGSRYNHEKRPFSDISLFHSVDGDRGFMNNVLIGDGTSLTELDIVTLNKNTEKEENYKKFTITAPYNFNNNGPNQLYSLAIRCYKPKEV